MITARRARAPVARSTLSGIVALSRPLALLALAFATALNTGCTVGPDYVRPPVVPPPMFKEAAGWKAAPSYDSLPDNAWWEAFNDPTLNALVTRVAVGNQSLAQAEAQVRQARALLDAARAGYFPTVTGRASASRSGSASNAGGVGSSVASGVDSRVRNQFALSADAAWEIDLWGRVRRTVEANAASAEASDADRQSILLSAQATLAQSYFQLRTLDREQQLLTDTVAIYERSLQLTQNRYNSGVVARADVVQAQTQLDTTRADLVDIGIARATLEHAIAVLIGEPPAALTVDFAPLVATAPPVPFGIPSELLERRPDIAAAERRMAAANAEIGVTTAAYFPQLTLSATGGVQSSTLSRLLSLPSRFWSVGPDLALTLFDGGLRRAQTAAAQAAYDATVAFYRQTVLIGFQEVEDNLAGLRILEQESLLRDQAVRSSQEAVTITTNQYRAGTISYLEVVTTQTIALNNQRSAADLLGRRMTASVALVKALGGGWHASALSASQ